MCTTILAMVTMTMAITVATSLRFALVVVRVTIACVSTAHVVISSADLVQYTLRWPENAFGLNCSFHTGQIQDPCGWPFSLRTHLVLEGKMR